MENTEKLEKKKAYYHLPGLFEFYDFYSVFLPLWRKHREFFYDWCDIGSIYGAPPDCIWSGGRIEQGTTEPEEVLRLLDIYDISGRLTFSNLLLRKEHLNDKKCNTICKIFEKSNVSNGVIVASDILTEYIKERYPRLYLVSSTTKVLTEFEDLQKELDREEYSYVVPDFRLNKYFDGLERLSQYQKDKVEFLCNECCYPGCGDRKACYEAVSRRMLGEDSTHVCKSPYASQGYRFSKAMENLQFIGVDDIVNVYLPMGYTNYKIEGRSLGSALLLEFILYYMTQPDYRLKVREEIYLDNMLDLF